MGRTLPENYPSRLYRKAPQACGGMNIVLAARGERQGAKAQLDFERENENPQATRKQRGPALGYKCSLDRFTSPDKKRGSGDSEAARIAET